MRLDFFELPCHHPNPANRFHFDNIFKFKSFDEIDHDRERRVHERGTCNSYQNVSKILGSPGATDMYH